MLCLSGFELYSRWVPHGIRESPYYRGFFLTKINENFVGTLETVRNIVEVSVLERCSTVI